MNHENPNQCPEGGKHSFVLGRCFNCGVSIRDHKAAMKELNRHRARTKHQIKRQLQTV